MKADEGSEQHDPSLPGCDLQADFPFDYAGYLAGGSSMGRLPDALTGAPEDEADSDVLELGCMRLPESATLLRHYAAEFGLRWLPSRDNYSPATPVTVLDVDGRRYLAQQLSDLYPQNAAMAAAHRGWLAAVRRAGVDELRRATAERDVATLRRTWRTVAERYETWSFYRFLRDPQGAGLDHDHAALLGTMGIGAAQRDSFFDLSMVEIFRLVRTTEGSPTHYPQEGISALVGGFWKHPTDTPTHGTRSLEDLHHGRPRPTVTLLEVPDDPARGVRVHDTQGRAQRFAAAVSTPLNCTCCKRTSRCAAPLAGARRSASGCGGRFAA